MITPDQITITSDLVYDGCGLSIGYKIGERAGFSFLSDEEIMKALFRTKNLQSFNPQSRVVTNRNGFLYSFDDYIRANLDSVVHQVLADHLNNRATKPVRP
jgi:hypothetical protein